MINVITPNWPAPGNVKACVTTRQGGVSVPPYNSFNVALHVGDDEHAVQRNRQQLREHLHLKNEPQWLSQVHGNRVIKADLSGNVPEADACFTTQKNVACAVLTADCLPVLFCSEQGDWVAAAHGGWRGLVSGILSETVKCFSGKPAQLIAWMGPAISAKHFEVGSDVRDGVLALGSDFAPVFSAGVAPNKWQADLYALARLQLQVLGVERVFGGDYCTFADAEKFYSYRRDGVTGRQASLVWVEE